MTKFNEGDKVRITGGYIVSEGLLQVGHEDTIGYVWAEGHVHEETGDVVDSYDLKDSGYLVVDEEIEAIQ